MKRFTYVCNTAFTFSAAEMLNRAVVLLAMMIPSHHYGVALFGRLGAALALTGIIIVVTNLIPVASITRDLCQQPERRVAIMSNYLWQRFAVMVVSTALLAAAYQSFAPDQVLLVALCYLYLYGAVTAATVRAGLMAEERFLAASIASVGGSALTLLGAYLPVRTGLSLEMMCAGLAVSQVLATGVVLALLAPRGYPPLEMLRLHIDWRYMGSELQRNLPLWLAMCLVSGYNRTNTVLCQALRGDHETGLFTAAFRVFEGLSLIAVIYQQVTYPRMVRDLGSASRTGGYMESSARVLILAAHLCAVLVVLGGYGLMGLIWGRGFDASGLTIRVLIWTLTFNLCSFVLSHILVAEERLWALTRVMLVALLVNVPANLLLIRLWGAPGAASGAVLTEAVVLGGILVALRGYHRSWRVCSTMLRSFASSAAALGTGTLVLQHHMPLAAALLIGSGAYLVGARALGVLRRQDAVEVFRRLMPERQAPPTAELTAAPPRG